MIGGGLEVAGVFDEVPQDSADTAVVEAAPPQAKDAGRRQLLAVGGGSVIDTAKVANVLFSHGGTVLDYEGIYQLPRDDDGMGRRSLAPLACIPTTAGTGSEVSFGAVIKDSEQGIKADPRLPAVPALAILDPESTATLPPRSPPRPGWTR